MCEDELRDTILNHIKERVTICETKTRKHKCVFCVVNVICLPVSMMRSPSTFLVKRLDEFYHLNRYIMYYFIIDWITCTVDLASSVVL